MIDRVPINMLAIITMKTNIKYVESNSIKSPFSCICFYYKKLKLIVNRWWKNAISQNNTSDELLRYQT